MDSIETEYACRACGQIDTQEANLLNVLLPPKESTLWRNRFCNGCGGISHYYSTTEPIITYSDSQYRNRQSKQISPVPLPWSAVTFERYLHISELVAPYLGLLVSESESETSIEHLDFGGYNGFTSFGLCQVFEFRSTVADLDQRGLRIAKALDCLTIDLSVSDLPTDEYQFITAVHVLEHLESPLEELTRVHRAMSAEGAIIYCEVPNILGTPTVDPSHLSSFSAKGLLSLFERTGFTVLDSGYCTTPSVAKCANWPLFSSIENLFIIASNIRVETTISHSEKMSVLSFLNKREICDIHTLSSRLYRNGIIIRTSNSLRYLRDAIKITIKNMAQIFVSVTILILPTTRLRNAVSKRLLQIRKLTDRSVVS